VGDDEDCRTSDARGEKRLQVMCYRSKERTTDGEQRDALWRKGGTPETYLLGLASGVHAVKTCRSVSKRGSPVHGRRRHPARSHLLLVVHLMWGEPLM